MKVLIVFVILLVFPLVLHAQDYVWCQLDQDLWVSSADPQGFCIQKGQDPGCTGCWISVGGPLEPVPAPAQGGYGAAQGGGVPGAVGPPSRQGQTQGQQRQSGGQPGSSSGPDSYGSPVQAVAARHRITPARNQSNCPAGYVCNAEGGMVMTNFHPGFGPPCGKDEEPRDVISEMEARGCSRAVIDAWSELLYKGRWSCRKT